ncbi:hypothetical protein POM88_053448 [Heracleum sosnowskyi]|uniref:Peptidase C1A papain C-terminal domain-containing protein n=1 Tax=Heracleum sosnowskyi TaxID=360622 RepID=A0AAD8GQ35_9APIA|nr:hypothetical protein POM88_053448 [Heracleum sosnowskyi]
MYQPIYRPVLQPQPRPFRLFYDINYDEQLNWVHDRPDITDTPILEQKLCACCWAIATATCLGFHLCLQCRIQVILSSQELVDNVRLYSHDVYGGWLQDTCYEGTSVDAYAVGNTKYYSNMEANPGGGAGVVSGHCPVDNTSRQQWTTPAGTSRQQWTLEVDTGQTHGNGQMSLF